MTILYINTGSSANAGDGDTLRTAFNKVNANFTYLSTASFSGGGGGAGAPGPSGPRGPQGTQGGLGPQGPQGPGADQRLNTTSSVTFTNITITNTATIPSLRVTAATVSTLNASTVTSDAGFFFNLTADGRTDLTNLNVTTNAQVSGVLTAPSALIAKLTGTNAIITTVTATNLTATGLRATVATATNLFATIGSVNTLTVVNKAFISNVDVTSTATFTGNAVFANTASFHNVLPAADAAYNLGSPTLRWKNLYVSTSTIYLAGDVVTVAAGQLTVNGNPVLGTATNTVLGGIKIGHNLAATSGGTLTSYQSVIDSSPPYDAQESDQWFDAVGGKQYVFYQGYWVETNLTGVGDPGARGPSGPVGPKGNTGDQGVSVTLVGSTATSAGLPLTGNAGDGWIVNDTGNLWFWSTANGQWEDIGQIVGPQGDAGDPGPEGPSGPSGPSGPIGYQGASGPSGAPSTVAGPSGPSGAQGDPGVNADFNYLGAFQIGSTYAKNDIVTYEGASYVAKGTVLPNVGSPDTNSTDWQLVTARGPSGPQGIQGPQGAQGNIGPSGPSGAQGTVGPSGVEGPSGPSGAQGEQGLPGGNANTADFIFTHSEMLAATNNDITVVTNANTWTFAADGTLTLPSGYSIGGGNGNDGIKLTTDRGTVLFGNTPECVPTQASHFHIMRDDPTTVDLFFGDDYNYVKLPYYSTLTNVGVEINADGYSWQFDKNGLLTLPGGNTRIGNFNGSDAIIGSTGTAVGVLSQGTGGYVALEWLGGDYENIGTSTQVAAVIVNSPIASSSGTVQIATGLVTGPTAENVWEFSSTGTLTAPGHLLPNADLAYDLGSTSSQWRSIYVGTGTVYIGGVALGVNQDNYVTVDGNPIITVNTASGALTIQGDTNIVLGSVAVSATAPEATTTGSQWFNTIDGRTYIALNSQWVDANPTVVPTPDTYLGDITIDGSTMNINGATLTINTAGTLLVNGSEVTGSGGTHIEYTDPTTDYVSTVDLTYDFRVDVDDAHLDINGDGYWSIGSNNFNAKVFSTNDPGNQPTCVVVQADDEDWTFGPLGMLTLPQGSIISEAMGAISLRPAYASGETQALMIYPTQQDGNHVHLTAGGGETDLYLGDDSQFVKVDHSGTIVVGTYSTTTNSTWTFGTNGVLTLSTASTILGASADPNVYIETSTTATTSTWSFGTDGVLTLPADTPIIKGGGTGTDVTVVATTGTNTATWVFGATGSITFPDATVQRTAYPTGQQNVLVNAASTATSIDLTGLTGSVIVIAPEAGYTTTGETHLVQLPIDDSIPRGTKITVVNSYNGIVSIEGWPGPEFLMGAYFTIDLVYIQDSDYPNGYWWVTNSFVWD